MVPKANSQKSTSKTSPTNNKSVEPPAVTAMKESLKKHGNGYSSSSSLNKRHGNNNNDSGGTGTAGSTPPKDEPRRRLSSSSPTNTNGSNHNRRPSSSLTDMNSSNGAKEKKNRSASSSPAAGAAPTANEAATTTGSSSSPPSATSLTAAAKAVGVEDNDDHPAPPSSTLAMRSPLTLLRTSRSDVQATSSPSAASSVLRRQSSLPATPSSSIAAANAASTLTHRLDRFGFIVNMDRHGNILPDDDNGTDGKNNKNAPPPDTAAKTVKSRGLRRRGGRGNGQTGKSAPTPQSSDFLKKRTAKRERKWQFMMDHWSKMSVFHAPNATHNPIQTRRRRKVITRLRKGVPDKYRGMVWKLLGNVPYQMKQNVGLYTMLVQRATSSVVTIAATPTSSAADHNISNDHSTAATAGTTVASTPTSAGARNLPDTVEVDTETNNQESYDQNAAASSGPTSVKHSKSFRNIQETIERDIHRTFPRHSMFYEEEKIPGGNNLPPHVQSMRAASNIGGYNDPDSAKHLSEEDDLILCGSGSEITDMFRELERGATTAVTATVGAAVAATGVVAARHGNGEQQLRQQQQDFLANNDDSDSPSPETILQSVGGQASLRRVLKAYSLYDREIGYCQGMNFIAGMFLTLMSEEESFWLLVDIMNQSPCRMRGLFGEGMRETHQVLHVAEKLIQQFLPKLSKHFDREHVHVTMFATQWLLTQYTSSFKFDLVTRVWDCFLAEGWKVTYRVMLALLKQWEGEILKMSFEDILAFFRDLPERIDGTDALMELAFKIPLRRSHIAKYEREWDQIQQQQAQART